MTDWRYFFTFEGTVTADDEDEARDEAYNKIESWIHHGVPSGDGPTTDDIEVVR